MKQRILHFLSLAMGVLAAVLCGSPIVRARTGDISFTFRMGGGFPGDVNRMHPASILAEMITPSGQVPRNYGDALLIDGSTNALRGAVAGDQSSTALNIRGILVRPFPIQQQSGGLNAPIAAGSPPTSGVIDVCRQGFVIVKLPAGASVVKGGTPFIWCAANSGNNVQGAFVAAASAGNTVPVANARYNGPADANGHAELEVWPA